MGDGETPQEMIDRYQTNPDNYCREHRIPNFRIHTRDQLIEHWALREDEDTIYAEEEGQYSDYFGNIIDGLPRDEPGA